MTGQKIQHKGRMEGEGAKEVAVVIAGLCAAIGIFGVKSHFYSYIWMSQD
jgi:hypothetical protein